MSRALHLSDTVPMSECITILCRNLLRFQRSIQEIITDIVFGAQLQPLTIVFLSDVVDKFSRSTKFTIWASRSMQFHRLAASFFIYSDCQLRNITGNLVGANILEPCMGVHGVAFFLYVFRCVCKAV